MKTPALLVVALVLAGAAPAAAAPAAGVSGALARAESLAAGQEVDAAIDVYKGVLAEGLDAPEVHYDLGTLEEQSASCYRRRR